jgi:aspartyl-tRNA(Asn)/glutamyl-tRNA(Gln) amidotransferase subunit A
MKIKEKLKKIKMYEITAEENVQKFLDEIKKNNKNGNNINAFLELNRDALNQAKEIDKKIKSGKKVGKLAGLTIAVKANISVKGMTISCASKTLDNYEGTYDATVIEKIRKEDGIIIGITNMDEFACGSSGETSAYGPVKNPNDLSRIPGGSSSGSAAAVAANFCDLAIGSDTGGSIRNPASHCGVIGIKPSYGIVSRYGLVDLSMSLDQIGTFCKDVQGAALLLSVIAGKDEKDATTLGDNFEYEHMLDNREKKRIGYCKELMNLCKDKKIKEEIEKKIKELEKSGNKIVEIELKHVNLAIQTYYPLVYVEFFSGTRKFNGRNYGSRIEDACGAEVLRRILGGSEISKAEYHGTYYRRALKAKQIIKKEFENAFERCDVIISPVVPRLPHKIGEKISLEDMYGYDALTIPANLAEICAVSVPLTKIQGIPVGIQVMAAQGKEAKMLQMAQTIEESTLL